MRHRSHRRGEGRQHSSPTPQVEQAKEALLDWSAKRPANGISLIKKRPLESVSACFLLGLMAGASKSGSGTIGKTLTNWALKQLLRKAFKH